MASSTTRPIGRNWSLPNVLTYARVAAVPLVAGFLFWPREPWARWTALAIFVAAAVTDFFDGYLARAWSQQSSLGRMLDPIADKLLVSAVILMLAANQTIAGRDAVGRDHHSVPRDPGLGLAGISGGVAGSHAGDGGRQMEDGGSDGRARLPDRGAGRARPSLPGSTMTGIVLMWIAAILTLYTGWDYMKASYDHVGND